jgi:hypothetical protein
MIPEKKKKLGELPTGKKRVEELTVVEEEKVEKPKSIFVMRIESPKGE